MTLHRDVKTANCLFRFSLDWTSGVTAASLEASHWENRHYSQGKEKTKVKGKEKREI